MLPCCHLLTVPDRVRHTSGSAHNANDTPFVVRQTATSFAEYKNKNVHLPLVSTGRGSGASAADAINIDSDEDISKVLSLSRTAMSRELPNHGTSNRDVINYSDPNAELLSPLRSENNAENDQEASSHSPLLPLTRELSPEDVSDIMSSDPPPSRALTKEKVAVALLGLRSDGTDVTTSDSEADGTVEEVNEVEDIDGSRISARHAEPPPLSSLQPIRNLLARRKRRGDPTRDVLPRGTIVTPRVSQIQGGKDFPEEAPVVTNSERDEESDFQASDPQLKRVSLPKTNHGRARRLLIPGSADLPLVAVTMRGDCHFIERKKK